MCCNAWPFQAESEFKNVGLLPTAVNLLFLVNRFAKLRAMSLPPLTAPFLTLPSAQFSKTCNDLLVKLHSADACAADEVHTIDLQLISISDLDYLMEHAVIVEARAGVVYRSPVVRNYLTDKSAAHPTQAAVELAFNLVLASAEPMTKKSVLTNLIKR